MTARHDSRRWSTGGLAATGDVPWLGQVGPDPGSAASRSGGVSGATWRPTALAQCRYVVGRTNQAIIMPTMHKVPSKPISAHLR